MSTHTVIIDGHNFLHRARAGFQLGEFGLVFNYFRNLRALVELLKPTSLFIVLEGQPKKRIELMADYKDNRKIKGDPNDPVVAKKLADKKDLFRQADLINAMLAYFPVTVARHEDFECDDTIYNLIKQACTLSHKITVVSNDSDFTQLLNEFDNVSLYNPMAKEYVKKPEYCYVTWKSLRGDSSDNIPGIKGIGDKTATAIVNDPNRLVELFQDSEKAAQFKRNYELIKFETWSKEETSKMTATSCARDWEVVKKQFTELGFNSILKEPSWTKFVSTFDNVFEFTVLPM
jgi:DNA polymerase I